MKKNSNRLQFKTILENAKNNQSINENYIGGPAAMSVPFITGKNKIGTIEGNPISHFDTDDGYDLGANDQQSQQQYQINLEDIETMSVLELRAFRRRIALLIHPDRNLGPQLTEAHNLMSAANRKIDEAIKKHQKR